MRILLSYEFAAKIRPASTAVCRSCRPHSPAPAQSDCRQRGLCLLSGRDPAPKPAEDQPPSGIFEKGGRSLCAKGRKVDALPRRTPSRPGRRLHPRCSACVHQDQPRNAGRSGSADTRLLPAAEICYVAGSARSRLSAPLISVLKVSTSRQISLMLVATPLCFGKPRIKNLKHKPYEPSGFGG
jgi:hypothetical protein